MLLSVSVARLLKGMYTSSQMFLKYGVRFNREETQSADDGFGN